MRIDEHQVGSVTVLRASGRLTFTEGPERIKDKVRSLIQSGRKQIVLNMAEVSYLDSSGLGELVACHLRAMQEGALIKLANAGGRTHDLLLLTKLVTIFETHDSEQAAVESFAATTA